MASKLAKMSSLQRENLLTNSDFVSGIINQKGQTSYGYVDTPLVTIDEWLSYGVNVAIDVTNVRVVNRQTSARTLRQYVNGDNGVYTVYVNVKTISGNVYVNLNNDTSKNKKLVQGKNIYQITVLSNETLKSLALYLEANADVYIYSIKLEKGSNFTGMPAWDETEELIKCYRRFISFFGSPITRVAFVGANYAFMTFELPIKMAKIPSIKFGDMSWQNDNTSNQVKTIITNCEVYSVIGNAITVKLYGNFGNTTWRVAYCSSLGIEFDAYDY